MLKRLMKRVHDDDAGFTLIELMVVVLIIGILVAIALPTFLGARSRAQDRAAQSSLRNALVAAKTLYTDDSNYGSANESGLAIVEPSLSYSGAVAASGGPTEVSVFVTDDTVGDEQVWAAASQSESGVCFYIMDIGTGPGTTFGSADAGTCTGTQAEVAAVDADW